MKEGSTTAVEREVPDVDDMPDATQPWAMTKIDPKAALVAFESAAELLRKLTPASIKATRPQDWVKMGERVYLQATGVERVAPLWGLHFFEPRVAREDYQGGEFAYIVTGEVESRFTGVRMVVEGGRSSSDPFFDSYDQEKPQGFRDLPSEEQAAWKRAHRQAPDPLDVRKAAVTNWMTRGASMLTGLRGLTSADLEANGIRGVAQVEFGKGGKGGETTPQDVAVDRVKLGNEVLAATGGDTQAARQLLKEITAGKGFAGFESVTGIKHQWQIDNARKKLNEHPVFGKQRQPGDEEPRA